MAVQPGLCGTWSETPETGFLRTRLKCLFCLGADIENIVNQAALKAARDRLEYVTMDALDFARDKVLMG